MISEVEMPSVRWVGANIPEEATQKTSRSEPVGLKSVVTHGTKVAQMTAFIGGAQAASFMVRSSDNIHSCDTM